MGMSLSREEKERFLKALEEDKEFRYAVMGLIGFKELLERFSKLEERQLRLEEEMKKLGERQQRLEERQARLEERQQRLEERQQRLEERQIKLEERMARLEERQQRLEERQQRLEERQLRLEEEMKKLWEAHVRLEEQVKKLWEAHLRLEEEHRRLRENVDRLWGEVRKLSHVVGALGRRFGKGFEALFREAYADLLRMAGLEGYRVERFRYVDVDGRYLARGTVVEIDIVVRDGELWVVEVKSTLEEDEVTWFLTKASIAEKVLGRRAAKKLILAVVADKEAVEAARKLGVDLIYVTIAD